jgi:hypothetical protein
MVGKRPKRSESMYSDAFVRSTHMPEYYHICQSLPSGRNILRTCTCVCDFNTFFLQHTLCSFGPFFFSSFLFFGCLLVTHFHFQTVSLSLLLFLILTELKYITTHKNKSTVQNEGPLLSVYSILLQHTEEL